MRSGGLAGRRVRAAPERFRSRLEMRQSGHFPSAQIGGKILTVSARGEISLGSAQERQTFGEDPRMGS